MNMDDKKDLEPEKKSKKTKSSRDFFPLTRPSDFEVNMINQNIAERKLLEKGHGLKTMAQ